jgi:hypothetical protein
MRTILIPLICSAHLLAAGSDSPSAPSTKALDPHWATVTIPYEELRSLWETNAAQNLELNRLREPRPPVPAVVLSSDYTIDCDSNTITLHAAYRIRTLTDDWHLVPLLGGEARLVASQPETSNLVWYNHRYCLLAQGKADHQLDLQFALPNPVENLSRRRVRLLPAAAAAHRIQIRRAPPGMMTRIPGFSAEPDSDGAVSYDLPAEIPELVIAFEPHMPQRPDVPTSWELLSEALVTFKEGRLLHHIRVQAQGNGGSGTSLDLVLPAHALDVQVEGDDLIDWRIGPAEDGTRTLNLAWQSGDQLHRIIMLSYQIPLSPLATHWSLHAPRVAGHPQQRALFVVLSVPGLGLSGPELSEGRRSHPLPQWIQDVIGPGDFYLAESDADLTLRAAWLPRLETSQAMISRAEFQTRIVADGGLLVTADYAFDHDTSLNWRVHLPEIGQLLTCQVNGRNVQPVRQESGVIELTLAAEHQTATRVAFSYTARLPELDAVSGSLTLELPRTDLFIHELNWVLNLPELYEITAFDGNARIANTERAGAENDGPVLRLKKELVQGESPKAEIHYQRRALTVAN